MGLMERGSDEENAEGGRLRVVQRWCTVSWGVNWEREGDGDGDGEDMWEWAEKVQVGVLKEESVWFES